MSLWQARVPDCLESSQQSESEQGKGEWIGRVVEKIGPWRASRLAVSVHLRVHVCEEVWGKAQKTQMCTGTQMRRGKRKLWLHTQKIKKQGRFVSAQSEHDIEAGVKDGNAFHFLSKKSKHEHFEGKIKLKKLDHMFWKMLYKKKPQPKIKKSHSPANKKGRMHVCKFHKTQKKGTDLHRTSSNSNY